MNSNRSFHPLIIVAVALPFAFDAHAANSGEQYICTPEISRAFVREDGDWRDLGPQRSDSFLVRAMNPNELRDPDRAEVTWGLFDPRPDSKPRLRCRKYSARVDCGYPGNAVSIALTEGRFTETIFQLGSGDFLISVTAGSCQDIERP